MSNRDRYLLFLEYFNKAKFTSAQMTLDEVWLDETGADKNFFGGLIQVAVALYHLTNENVKGAGKIYEKAREMLSPYPEIHHGLSLKKLIDDCDDLFKNRVKPDDPTIDYTKLLPKITFTP